MARFPRLLWQPKTTDHHVLQFDHIPNIDSTLSRSNEAYYLQALLKHNFHIDNRSSLWHPIIIYQIVVTTHALNHQYSDPSCTSGLHLRELLYSQLPPMNPSFLRQRWIIIRSCQYYHRTIPITRLWENFTSINHLPHRRNPERRGVQIRVTTA